MKKLTMLLLTFGIILGAWIEFACATPSTTFWTPSTSDVQPYGVVHLGIDNYFTLGKKGADKGALPTDLTLPEVGILPYDKLQLEVGMDVLEPLDHPLLFNFKFGTPEGSLFSGSPAINIGMFDIGTHGNIAGPGDTRTNFDITDFIVGKTLPFSLGRIHVGGYYGNPAALVDKNGAKANTGFMVGWDKGLFSVKDGSGEYDKVVLAADYASGKNYIGGGGGGVYYYFTRDISLLTGPVWFNEPAVAGPLPSGGAKWVWTTQLDINFL